MIGVVAPLVLAGMIAVIARRVCPAVGDILRVKLALKRGAVARLSVFDPRCDRDKGLTVRLITYRGRNYVADKVGGYGLSVREFSDPAEATSLYEQMVLAAARLDHYGDPWLTDVDLYQEPEPFTRWCVSLAWLDERDDGDAQGGAR